MNEAEIQQNPSVCGRGVRQDSRGGPAPNTRSFFGKTPIYIPPAPPVTGHRFLLSEGLLEGASREIHAYRLGTDDYIPERELHGMQSDGMWKMTERQDIFLSFLVVGVLQGAAWGAEADGVEGFLRQFEQWAAERAKRTGTRVRNRIPTLEELADWGDEAFVARAIWPIRKYVTSGLGERWPMLEDDVLSLARVEVNGVTVLKEKLISEFSRRYRGSELHGDEDIEEAVDDSISLMNSNPTWLASYPVGTGGVGGFIQAQLRKKVADKMPRYIEVPQGDVWLVHGSEAEAAQRAEWALPSNDHKPMLVRVSSREARRRENERPADDDACVAVNVAQFVEATGRKESTVRQALTRVEAALEEKAPRRAGARSDHRLDERWLRLLKAELDRTPVRRPKKSRKLKKP